MSGNTSNENQEQESYIHISFTEPGSTVFGIEMKGILPGQMLAIAGYLETRAKAIIVQDIEREAQQKAKEQLSVPESKIEITK